MKKLRYLPFVLIGFNVLVGLMALIAAGGTSSGAKGFLAFNMFLALVATMSLSIFRFGKNRATTRIRATMDELARRAFDAPVQVTPGFESSLVGALGVVGPGGRFDDANGFTAKGTVNGVATKIASAVSVAGRQPFETNHVYSHVSVDPENAAGRFRFLGRDRYANWAKKFGSLTDNPLGDKAFDKAWIVAGDSELAAAVLDPALREQLTALQERSRSVSTVGMSIELTGAGLFVRWPGDLDTELAMTSPISPSTCATDCSTCCAVTD